MYRAITLIGTGTFLTIVLCHGSHIASVISQDGNETPDKASNGIAVYANNQDSNQEPRKSVQGRQPTPSVPRSPAGVYSLQTPAGGGRSVPALLPAVETRDVWGQMYTASGLQSESESNRAYRVLQKAETDEEKREAEIELRDALNREYEKSLDEYGNHLDKMAEKLQQLRDELERRSVAKDELVELRFKTLVNQAQGLGWPGQSSMPGFNNPIQLFDQNQYYWPGTGRAPAGTVHGGAGSVMSLPGPQQPFPQQPAPQQPVTGTPRR